MSKTHENPHVGSGKFSVRGFRPQRQWEVDCDYLRRLPDAEREWMRRFLAEYYDADNKLLRPQKHYSECPKCSRGGTCGRRPPPVPLHASDDLRRECYRRQKSAYEDAYSAGRVSLWEDFDSVDSSGNVASTSFDVRGRKAALRARQESGDYELCDATSAPAVIAATKRKK